MKLRRLSGCRSGRGPSIFAEFCVCPPNGGLATNCHCLGMNLSLTRTPASVTGTAHASPLGRRRFLTAVVVTTIVATSLIPATGASAQWGAPEPQRYCSSSVGCYVDPSTGRAVYTTLGPTLTARERALLGQCQTRLAGSGFGLAGGIAARNWLAILGAAFNGGAALTGPCKDLWNSTARYRRS